MSQHASEPCNGSNELWLPLIEYSVKSGLSLSTIRRKIKSNSVHFRLDKGKYFILFEETGEVPVLQQHPAPRPVPVPRIEPKPVLRDTRPQVDNMDNAIKAVTGAFERTLTEKDERIHLLERTNRELDEQINELRLLVRVLEEKYQVRY